MLEGRFAERETKVNIISIYVEKARLKYENE